MKRALLSVSDKTGIIELANFLRTQNIEIISTGGTGKLLSENQIPYTAIQDITGNPEAFGGRMKTISFQVASGLLFRRSEPQDIADAKSLEIEPIDIVVCNLYPFEEVAKKKAELATLIENIDIGGPTMIRAAAKNYPSVSVLTNPKQYESFINNYTNQTIEDRYQLALDAFSMTAHYDQFIVNHLLRDQSERAPLPIVNLNQSELRYGENPHQAAWLSQVRNTEQMETLANATPLQGKALSYNNMLDADAAWKCNSDLNHIAKGQTSLTIIKHANPCGVALGENSLEALKEAWACDPVSSFGSVICSNKAWNKEMSEWLSDKFVEIIIAPSFDEGAREVLAKKKNLRLIELAPKPKNAKEMTVRSINGGLLIQEEDERVHYEYTPSSKTKLSEETQTLRDFGMIVNKYLKSNGITLVARRNNFSVLAGGGMGQPNRLDSLKMLAAPRARALEYEMSEVLLVSDAFFPFRDSIEVCAEVGIKNIIQPGGSIRDQEVIDACDEFGIAMEFTGVRHFRH